MMMCVSFVFFFFFSGRRRHTRCGRDWSSDVCSSDLHDFAPGDTLQVNVKVVEGTRERLQAYEGVCIARAGGGLNENFTVRKISYGEGVERVFPLYSPLVDSIKVVRRGRVRRAKIGRAHV